MKKLVLILALLPGLHLAPLLAKEVKVEVKGMHCGGCEGLVEEALEAVPGVTKVKAHSKKGYAVMSMADDAAVDEAVIKKAVTTAGKRYSAGKISK